MTATTWLGTIHVILLAVLAGMATNPLLAASADGQFAIQGRGGDTCGAYVSAREAGNDEYRRFASWLAGYLTAYNQFHEDTVDVVPWQGADYLGALLAQYCEKHPEEIFAHGVSNLARVLYPQRLRRESKLVTIDSGTESVRLYEEVIRRVQAALRTRGLYAGPLSGEFDTVTRVAVQRFQQSIGMPGSGVPGQRTLHELFRQQ